MLIPKKEEHFYSAAYCGNAESLLNYASLHRFSATVLLLGGLGVDSLASSGESLDHYNSPGVAIVNH